MLLGDESHAAGGIDRPAAEFAGAQNRVKQCGFAHAVRAEHRDEFSASHLKIQPGPQWIDGSVVEFEDHGGAGNGGRSHCLIKPLLKIDFNATKMR